MLLDQVGLLRVPLGLGPSVLEPDLYLRDAQTEFPRNPGSHPVRQVVTSRVLVFEHLDLEVTELSPNAIQ